MNVPRSTLRHLSGIVLVAFLSASSAAVRADNPSAPVIRLSEMKGTVTIEVTGLSKETLSELARMAPDPEKCGKAFAVYVERSGKERNEQPAMVGNYKIETALLRFVPRYPLVRGVRYRAVFNPAALSGGECRACPSRRR